MDTDIVFVFFQCFLAPQEQSSATYAEAAKSCPATYLSTNPIHCPGAWTRLAWCARRAPEVEMLERSEVKLLKRFLLCFFVFL